MQGWTHPPDLAGQFRLGPASFALREGETTHPLETLRLHLYAPLRAVRVVDAADASIGMLLGIPVDYRAGTVLRGTLRLAEWSDADIDGSVERSIYALGGKFIFVLDRSGHRRVYLDACGSLSAVYDPEKGEVGATAPVLLTSAEAETRFDRELYDFLELEREGWFPAGLTAHRGVRRILVNHYLDLNDWRLHRHWPRETIAITGDPVAACGRILDSTRRGIEALAAEGSVMMSLTAGNETRLLTAAARNVLDRIEFVTVDAPGQELDRARARELARRFGLDHWLLPLKRAAPAEEAAWRARTGHCIGGSNAWSHPSVRAMAGRPFAIGGLGGEIGRGFLWRPGDAANSTVTPAGLIARLGLRSHPRLLETVEAWFPGIAGYDAFLQLDLAYIELRMGPWAFAQAYASPDIRLLHPMISRESFTAMLSLPPDWRRNNRMIGETVRLAWPELMELPINRYGDWRDHWHLARRALRDPKRVANKLRKMLG